MNTMWTNTMEMFDKTMASAVSAMDRATVMLNGIREWCGHHKWLFWTALLLLSPVILLALGAAGLLGIAFLAGVAVATPFLVMRFAGAYGKAMWRAFTHPMRWLLGWFPIPRPDPTTAQEALDRTVETGEVKWLMPFEGELEKIDMATLPVETRKALRRVLAVEAERCHPGMLRTMMMRKTGKPYGSHDDVLKSFLEMDDVASIEALGETATELLNSFAHGA